MKELFSEENKVPDTLFEAREVAGSATCKQGKTPLRSAGLFTHENKDSLFLVKIFICSLTSPRLKQSVRLM